MSGAFNANPVDSSCRKSDTGAQGWPRLCTHPRESTPFTRKVKGWEEKLEGGPVLYRPWLPSLLQPLALGKKDLGIEWQMSL